MALRNIGADFERYLAVEIDKYAMASYNAVHGTDFPETDICKMHGSDLKIVDRDKYCYLMFYSFPCTDLSVAGRMQGMDEDSGTNSALLWEVKRLLEETDELPQILIMENVTAVHSNENIANFHKWLDFLSDKGYVSYVDDLNAKDYGVAQNRDRTFCVSLLGEYNYHFPKPIELRYVMKDYLEENVDEKYYINSDKANDLIQKLIDDGTLADDDEEPNTDKWTTDLCKDPSERDISLAITARQDRGSTGGVSLNTVHMNYRKVKCKTDLAMTLTAREYKGFGTSHDVQNGVIEDQESG